MAVRQATVLHPARGGELSFSPPDRSPEQRWVLACQGILSALNRADPLYLGGGARPLRSHLPFTLLRRFWGVVSGSRAVETLEWLLSRGQRFELAARSSHTPDELAAWDFARAAAVAGWAYRAYLLDADTAWSFMIRAAHELQRSFASWAEVGESYASARRLFGGDAADIEKISAKLSAAGGAWDLPWQVELASDIAPPVDTLPELVVDASGGGDFTTISAAVAKIVEQRQATRIVVRAGTYEESVVLGHSCELIADGDVTIRSSEGAPIILEWHVARVRGFRLESGTNTDGMAMQAVWVGKYFLKLEDCTLRSARCGVYAGKEDGIVIVERCRIESAEKTGILLEHGAHGSILDSSIAGVHGTGVLSSGNLLRVERSQIVAPGGVGLAIGERCTLEIDDVDIERSGNNGVDLHGGASVSITKLRVDRAGRTGMFVHGRVGRDVSITDSTITESGANDVGVLGAAAVLTRCRVGGGGGSGVTVGEGGRVEMVDCAIETGKLPSATVMADGTAVFHRSTLRGGTDMALWVMPRGAATLVDCAIHGGPKHGALLDGAKDVHILGGRIESDAGCVFAKDSRAVVMRDVVLSGGSPALCAQTGTDLVMIDCEATTSGAVAVSIEKATLALTRSRIAAPSGTALALEAGEAHLFRGSLEGRVAANVDGDSSLSTSGTSFDGPVEGPREEIAIDETELEPAKLTLLSGRRLALELPMKELGVRFAALGREITEALACDWLAAVVSSCATSEAVEIDCVHGSARIVGSDFTTLREIAKRVAADLATGRHVAMCAKPSEREVDTGSLDDAWGDEGAVEEDDLHDKADEDADDVDGSSGLLQ